MIVVNGEPVAEVAGGATVEVVLEHLGVSGLDTRGVAVAVDGEVVPRAEWSAFAVAEGARVEVLRAVQGG